MSGKRAVLIVLILGLPVAGRAASGSEGASFLDIPVGARPAALGSAYGAAASDAYAPVWNPGGLGFLDCTQVSSMHMAGQDSISYEYAGAAQPLAAGRSLGAAVQYLNPGHVTGMDALGHPLGDVSGSFAAFSLAYGQTLTGALSLGAAFKLVSARLADVSASAYAADIGAMLQAGRKLSLSFVADNIGTKLSFIGQKDALPLGLRLGAFYRAADVLGLAVEGRWSPNGLSSLHGGLEWSLVPAFSVRMGYRTDDMRTMPGAPAAATTWRTLAGFTTGLGVSAWGAQLDYAWLPFGELGSAQYFSLVLKFGAAARAKTAPNLMLYGVK